MNKDNQKIDFIIPWVDGSDPEWIKEHNKYVNDDNTIDIRNFRYRDWDNLQYWFRGIEKFTPWVNNIYFITWGHLPKWLNTDHPKLHIVKHQDFIPKENLPVFNVNPLEINLHRIKGIADKFVYFNDDTFILNPTEPERFFKNGLPCDMAAETIFLTTGISHIRLNDLHLINKHFSKRQQIFKHISKWINLKYGLGNVIRTLLLLPFSKYSGFYNAHKPNSYLKSTFEKVWNKNKSILEETSRSKFRSLTDVNQYLFQYWQLISGEFVPTSIKDTIHVELSNTDSIKTDNNTELSNRNVFSNKVNKVVDIIKNQECKMICINDGETNNSQFEDAKNKIISAFNTILGEKSAFEL